MIHATKGIVLRSIRYGDTSIVATLYTELFGLQSYLVQGVRTSTRSAQRASMYQPTFFLDLVVYHHPHKNLQRIKEARLQHPAAVQQGSMVKNAIGIYIVELIGRAISEPEHNPDLFYFFESSFQTLRSHSDKDLANLPVLFTLQFADHLGFGIRLNYTDATPLFNLQEGMFVPASAQGPHLLDADNSRLLFCIVSQQTSGIDLSGEKRSQLLLHCIRYLKLHIPHLGEIRSLPVLHELLS